MEQSRATSLPFTLLALLAAFVMALPMLWMLSTAFKPAGEYVSTGITLLPQAPTLEHFIAVLGEQDLPGKLLNSVIVTMGATLLALLAGFPAAYALVRLNLPARLDTIFLVFVLVIKLVPPLALAVPLYQVLRAIGLLDTLAGLILTYQVYTLPMAIWLLLGFVRDVPIAYEEAARIDGAGLVRRLTTIVLPVMAPGIGAATILLAILAWNEFTYALLFIQSPDKFTLPVYVAGLITEDETFWGRLSAIGLIGSLPLIATLALFQKYLLRGLVGGLK